MVGGLVNFRLRILLTMLLGALIGFFLSKGVEGFVQSIGFEISWPGYIIVAIVITIVAKTLRLI